MQKTDVVNNRYVFQNMYKAGMIRDQQWDRKVWAKWDSLKQVIKPMVNSFIQICTIKVNISKASSILKVSCRRCKLKHVTTFNGFLAREGGDFLSFASSSILWIESALPSGKHVSLLLWRWRCFHLQDYFAWKLLSFSTCLVFVKTT